AATSPGSATTYVKYPARFLISLSPPERAHVAPPSFERTRPPESASTSAHTRSWLTGETARPILPMIPCGSPRLRVISFHVSPPSVDFQIPLPGPPDTTSPARRTPCRTPTYSRRGWGGSIARPIAPALP